MISKRLRILFLLSLFLIAAHGIEEVTTGFLYKDSFVALLANLFDTKVELFYWSFHIMWWLMLVIAYLLILGGRWTLFLMSLFGVVFIFELHHVIKGVLAGGYYPGMITGLSYPVLGFFYWKEVIKNWKRYGRN